MLKKNLLLKLVAGERVAFGSPYLIGALKHWVPPILKLARGREHTGCKKDCERAKPEVGEHAHRLLKKRRDIVPGGANY